MIAVWFGPRSPMRVGPVPNRTNTTVVGVDPVCTRTRAAPDAYANAFGWVHGSAGFFTGTSRMSASSTMRASTSRGRVSGG